MPILKSAIKRSRQNLVRKARNYDVRAALRKSIRAVSEFAKAGQKKEAAEALSTAFKVIDTAAKKKIIPENTAARRKSTLAKKVATL